MIHMIQYLSGQTLIERQVAFRHQKRLAYNDVQPNQVEPDAVVFMQKKPSLSRFLVAIAPLVTVLTGIFVAGVFNFEPKDHFVSWGVATAAAIFWFSGTLIVISKSSGRR